VSVPAFVNDIYLSAYQLRDVDSYSSDDHSHVYNHDMNMKQEHGHRFCSIVASNNDDNDKTMNSLII
jgi:hypothetical protein